MAHQLGASPHGGFVDDVADAAPASLAWTTRRVAHRADLRPQTPPCSTTAIEYEILRKRKARENETYKRAESCGSQLPCGRLDGTKKPSSARLRPGPEPNRRMSWAEIPTLTPATLRAGRYGSRRGGIKQDLTLASPMRRLHAALEDRPRQTLQASAPPRRIPAAPRADARSCGFRSPAPTPAAGTCPRCASACGRAGRWSCVLTSPVSARPQATHSPSWVSLQGQVRFAPQPSRRPAECRHTSIHQERAHAGRTKRRPAEAGLLSLTRVAESTCPFAPA